MKLAKKVLAIVMALGLIACMSAMAFATDGGYGADVTTITTDKVGNVTLTFYASNATGLASGKLIVTYDSGVQFNYGTAGKQAKAVQDAIGNGFSYDINDTESGSGKVIYGFYFTDNLWDSATFAERGEVEINTAKFDIAVLNFKVTDAAKANVTVNFEGKDVLGGVDTFVNTYDLGSGVTAVTPKPESSVPTDKKDEEKKDDQGKPAEEAAPAAEAAAEAAKTNTGAKTVKTDGGKNTGDNGVIAVVAGVIALAGAAFVVTKKRK